MGVRRRANSVSIEQTWLCLKRHTTDEEVIVDDRALDGEDAFSRIRCPLCEWHPGPSSRWCCEAGESPEPYFEGCHTVWNTFTTGGMCPGCSHLWTWTSCLRCGGWSLHAEWYTERPQKAGRH